MISASKSVAASTQKQKDDDDPAAVTIAVVASAVISPVVSAAEAKQDDDPDDIAAISAPVAHAPVSASIVASTVIVASASIAAAVVVAAAIMGMMVVMMLAAGTDQRALTGIAGHDMHLRCRREKHGRAGRPWNTAHVEPSGRGSTSRYALCGRSVRRNLPKELQTLRVRAIIEHSTIGVMSPARKSVRVPGTWAGALRKA